MKDKKNKLSKYATKLAKRKAAGNVGIYLPIGRDGEPTLNPEHFRRDEDGIVTRFFPRLRRIDEC